MIFAARARVRAASPIRLDSAACRRATGAGEVCSAPGAMASVRLLILASVAASPVRRQRGKRIRGSEPLQSRAQSAGRWLRGGHADPAYGETDTSSREVLYSV